MDVFPCGRLLTQVASTLCGEEQCEVASDREISTPWELPSVYGPTIMALLHSMQHLSQDRRPSIAQVISVTCQLLSWHLHARVGATCTEIGLCHLQCVVIKQPAGRVWAGLAVMQARSQCTAARAAEGRGINVDFSPPMQ